MTKKPTGKPSQLTPARMVAATTGWPLAKSEATAAKLEGVAELYRAGKLREAVRDLESKPAKKTDPKK